MLILNKPRQVFHLCFLLLAMLLLMVLSFKGLRSAGDDVMYAKALQDRSLVNYLTERYTIWSGRAAVDALTLLVIPHEWLWRSLMLFILLLSLGLMAHVTQADQRVLGLIFLFQGFFLLPRGVMSEAVWWMTGSFNYLWPWAAASLALLPFLRPELLPRLFIVALPAALYGASQEQAGLLLLGFQLLAGIGLLRTGQLRWRHAVLMLVALLALIGVVAAPGTSARYSVVTSYWFPEYSEWHLDERIFAGFDLAFSHFFRSENIISIAFVVLLCILVFQRTRSPAKRLIALVPVLLYLLQAVPRLLRASSQSWVQTIAEIWSFQKTPEGFHVYGVGDYFQAAVNSVFYGHFFLVMLGVCCVGFSISNASIRSRFIAPGAAVLIFIAAILSAAIMGLSPTLYASGARIFFFQNMLVLLLATLVFMQVEGERLKRIVNGIFTLGMIVALWHILKKP
ncbi:DUF6056 family protein [Xylophilus sp. ASV27]|uniref:DUF6056 family protein n=1 Tax=Xylophilus sp. ASV27 TaxID=2795129 RepID=UPI0018ED4AB9|nr:DUF6056 family protein [Xylophilus sp. ASV27]